MCACRLLTTDLRNTLGIQRIGDIVGSGLRLLEHVERKQMWTSDILSVVLPL